MAIDIFVIFFFSNKKLFLPCGGGLLGYKTEFKIRVLCGRGRLCTILTERELDPILTYPTQRSTLDLLFLIKK